MPAARKEILVRGTDPHEAIVEAFFRRATPNLRACPLAGKFSFPVSFAPPRSGAWNPFLFAGRWRTRAKGAHRSKHRAGQGSAAAKASLPPSRKPAFSGYSKPSPRG